MERWGWLLLACGGFALPVEAAPPGGRAGSHHGGADRRFPAGYHSGPHPGWGFPGYYGYGPVVVLPPPHAWVHSPHQLSYSQAGLVPVDRYWRLGPYGWTSPVAPTPEAPPVPEGIRQAGQFWSW